MAGVANGNEVENGKSINSLCVFLDHWSSTHAQIIESMNWLQDRGIISDNAIWPQDVEELDARRAVDALRGRQKITMDSTGRFARVENFGK